MDFKNKIKMFYKLTLFLFFILLLVSCNNTIKENKIEIINLQKSFKKSKKINLSDIATNIEYIQLENDTSALIGLISKPNKNIQFVGNNIFIDNDEILRFNKKGKYINKIGSIGKGPEEYIESSSFTIFENKKDTIISVFSAPQRKTLLFDLKNNYKGSFSVKFWPTSISIINEDFVFINSFGRRNESNYAAFTIVSSQNKKIKKRLLHKWREKNQSLALSSLNNYYYNKDTLSYWESNYDTIWRIDKELNSIPKFKIDIGENTLPIESFNDKNVFNFSIFSKYDKVERLYETANFIFFNVNYRKKLHRICFNKKTKVFLNVKFKRPFGKGIHFAFYNNLDGGVPFWPMGKVSDKKVFMIVYGYEMREYIARRKIKLEKVNTIVNTDLKEIIKKSKLSDNPILMIVTLK